jgi:hypothetical protein
MAKRSAQPNPISDVREELGNALRSARAALKRADGWNCDPPFYDRLRRDLEQLGLRCHEQAVTSVLRQAFDELEAEHLNRREEPSYGGSSAQVLYEGCWDSKGRGCRMYIKFAITEDSKVDLFTYHASTKKAQPLRQSHEMH